MVRKAEGAGEGPLVFLPHGGPRDWGAWLRAIGLLLTHLLGPLSIGAGCVAGFHRAHREQVGLGAGWVEVQQEKSLLLALRFTQYWTRLCSRVIWSSQGTGPIFLLLESSSISMRL